MKATLSTGTIYRNSGSLFLVTEVKDRNWTEVVNIKSGWECVAHGTHQDFSNEIWWDYSTQGRFIPAEHLQLLQEEIRNGLYRWEA